MALSRITLAHYRLHEEGLDINIVEVRRRKHGLQRLDVIWLDRQQVIGVLERGKVSGVVTHRRVGEASRPIGATMEAALERQPTDRPPFVATTGVRHVLRMNIRDAHGNRHRLGAAIHAQEALVRETIRPVMADLFLESSNEIELVGTRRHDVCHDMRLVHGVQHALRSMPETQHAVTANVVDDRTLEGNYPGSRAADGDIGIYSVPGVEIRHPGVRLPNL